MISIAQKKQKIASIYLSIYHDIDRAKKTKKQNICINTVEKTKKQKIASTQRFTRCTVIYTSLSIYHLSITISIAWKNKKLHLSIYLSTMISIARKKQKNCIYLSIYLSIMISIAQKNKIIIFELLDLIENYCYTGYYYYLYEWIASKHYLLRTHRHAHKHKIAYILKRTWGLIELTQ